MQALETRVCEEEGIVAKITVACAALSGRIYAGRINKAGTGFLAGKQDVTSDVLKAIIDKVGPGHVETISVGGVPRYEIEVREVSQEYPAGCLACTADLGE